MPPCEPQQGRPRSLGGLGARVPLRGLGGERHGGNDRPLSVGVGDLAEQLVIQRCVDRYDGRMSVAKVSGSTPMPRQNARARPLWRA